jgi:hypothetical protein
MTSSEVQDAIGAAPTKEPISGDHASVLDQLRAKRSALADAQSALTDAQAKYDEQGVVDAARRIEALQGFIIRLEAEAQRVLEAEGVRRAKAWTKKRVKELAIVGQKIGAAQMVVRAKLKELVAAIEVEAGLRESIEQFDLADQVLGARFGMPRNDLPTSVPDLEDWGSPVLTVTDSMRPSRRQTPQLVVPTIASDSAETRRKNAIRASVEFASRVRKRLPAEVLAIVESAPVPAEAPTGKPKDSDEAVIGTGSHGPALSTAATEAVALAALGMPGGNVHRG